MRGFERREGGLLTVWTPNNPASIELAKNRQRANLSRISTLFHTVREGRYDNNTRKFVKNTPHDQYAALTVDKRTLLRPMFIYKIKRRPDISILLTRFPQPSRADVRRLKHLLPHD